MGRSDTLVSTRFRVTTPGGEYPVVVGVGVRSELERWPGSGATPSMFFLVTDANVDVRHGASVGGALRATGRPVSTLVIPPGETTKCPEELVRLWREMVRGGCDRDSCVVALGGGVVGDLAGFAAASVLRGIALVQVPTTLLSMVDASVGGKTGIDLPEGKNLVGAFHQPRAVVMDLEFLSTLPDRELRSGWAEVIKTAAIRDAALFESVEDAGKRLETPDLDLLAGVVGACAQIKANVVGADEKESGLRRILNFGHTLAHGIETALGYGSILHGEAVSVGMLFAAELGESLGLTECGTAVRLRRCVETAGLPARLKGLDADRLLALMERDKKRGPSGIRWVFLEAIGRAVIEDGVPADRVRAELRRFLASS